MAKAFRSRTKKPGAARASRTRRAAASRHKARPAASSKQHPSKQAAPQKKAHQAPASRTAAPHARSERKAAPSAPAQVVDPGGSPMVQWRKAPPEMIALFAELLTGVPQSEARKMFGYPAAFRRGNMFAGLFQEQLVLRLAEGDREVIFAAKRATPFMPMPGRAMREYVSFAKPLQTAREELQRWVKRSFAYADALPAKPGKK